MIVRAHRSLPDSACNPRPFRPVPTTNRAVAATRRCAAGAPWLREESRRHGSPASGFRPQKHDQHSRSLSFFASNSNLPSPRLDESPAYGKSKPASGCARREMWLEDARQHTRGNPRAVIYGLDHHPAFFFSQNDLDLTRAREACVLEHVEQDVSHLVLLRHRPDRAIGAAHLPLHNPISHLLQGDNILYDGRDIDRNRGRQIRRRAPVSAERARDFVQSIDFRENSSDIFVENGIVVDARVAPRSPEMLDAESDRRQRILDLVRNLSRHLSPRQHALSPRYFDSAKLEIPCQPLGGDAAQPQRRERSSSCGKKHQHPQVAAAPIENEVVTARRRGEHITLLTRPEGGTVSKQHLCWPELFL